MKQRRKIAMFTSIMIAFLLVCLYVETTRAATGSDVPSTESTEEPADPSFEEPEESDLVLNQRDTVLSSPRWIQNFAKDSKAYYFVQMTNPEKGHLRITRVKYKEPGVYTRDHMDLKGFGHGTNMDTTIYNGKTYIWIGSKMNKKTGNTEAISCFKYKKNAVYDKKAGNTYTIRRKGTLSKATNVFPAISQDLKYLFVRYTYKGKQYFQKYKIYNGCKIKNNKPLMKLEVSKTKGDFQGFDVYKNYIYTIEGSPTALFLSGYDKSRVFQPTVVRRVNYKTKSKKSMVINGAQDLSFREPEGIDFGKDGRAQIMFVSNTLTQQRCNLYYWKNK